jgi:opacity protein-like surface antigen
VLLAVGALGAFLARPAAAQANSDPGFQVGGFAAVSKSRAAETSNAAGGLLARARVTGALGIEGLVEYRHETYAVAGDRVLRVQEFPVQGSVQLFFLYRRPFQPYVLAGASYTYVRWSRVDRDDSGSENRFGFHGGLGVTARLGGKATGFAEVRYTLLDVGAVLDLPGGPKSDYWRAAAGALFSF